MDPISELAKEVIEDLVEEAVTRPAAPQVPTGEDREDRSSYYVRNIMPSIQEERCPEEDRDDDR
ncbi:MAG: hypothetical protein M0Z41_00025 [Peptococcaceae bacterium]|jgi:hypothetical protein|nr:hypothetical protein [Peptococcaceae bacterium]